MSFVSLHAIAARRQSLGVAMAIMAAFKRGEIELFELNWIEFFFINIPGR